MDNEAAAGFDKYSNGFFLAFSLKMFFTQQRIQIEKLNTYCVDCILLYILLIACIANAYIKCVACANNAD